MTETQATVPGQLARIIEDFELAEGREKLDLLMEYAERMPPLPEWVIQKRAEMDEVPECMTPVSVLAENRQGKMRFYFDVPRESPTVRGFAAMISEGLQDLTPEQILQVPNDFYQQMGLDQVLTQQRLNGISAILAHMKKLAVEEL